MLYKLAAYIHMAFARRARRIVAALEGERGQGTVEYVGLILLVSLLDGRDGGRHEGVQRQAGDRAGRRDREQDQAGRERDHVPLSTSGGQAAARPGRARLVREESGRRHPEGVRFG